MEKSIGQPSIMKPQWADELNTLICHKYAVCGYLHIIKKYTYYTIWTACFFKSHVVIEEVIGCWRECYYSYSSLHNLL